MSILDLLDLKEQLSFTSDMGVEDDPLLTRKLLSAQEYVERMLGYRIEDRFGGEDQAPIPQALVQAILQLAAWWYENRETAGEGAREVPFGVSDIVMNYRDWSF